MRFIYLFIILLAVPRFAGADALSDLQAENIMLKAELQLAKSNKLYMVVDLPGEAVLFKAGGVVVNRLPFIASRLEGPSPLPALRTLKGKIAEKQPKRQEVKIVTEAEMEAAPPPVPGVDTLVALEIDDMPEIYQLELDDGLLLAVKAPPSGDFKTKAVRYWRDAVEAVKSWYQTLQRKMGGGPTGTRIVLNLAGPDARQFYWSFDEGMACLVRVK